MFKKLLKFLFLLLSVYLISYFLVGLSYLAAAFAIMLFASGIVIYKWIGVDDDE